MDRLPAERLCSSDVWLVTWRDRRRVGGLGSERDWEGRRSRRGGAEVDTAESGLERMGDRDEWVGVVWRVKRGRVGREEGREGM
jgi:hypothetical protein